MSPDGVRNLGVQEANIIDLVAPITKMACVVHNPEDIFEIMNDAIHIATTGRPGPVWIDVPMDVQGSPCFSIEDEIQNAERPLILAGNGVNCADAKFDFRVVYT